MPTFSADGRMLAFNFWSGATTNGVTPATGGASQVMDFTAARTTAGSRAAVRRTPSATRARFTATRRTRATGMARVLAGREVAAFSRAA